MIKYHKNNKIDNAKYDACIYNDKGTQMYGYSWYLDIVTDDWSCLVYGDYEVVMPIPYMRTWKNFKTKKIIQPIFCQQLGLFSKGKVSTEVYKLFYNTFVELKPFQYSFNSRNSGVIPFDKGNLISKINYELRLNSKYDLIVKNYYSNLLRNIKKAKKNELLIKNNSLVMDFLVLKLNYAQSKWSKSMMLTAEKLLNTLIEKNLGKLYWVYNGEDLVAGAFFIETGDRLIHLISYSSEYGRKVAAIPFLLDSIIEKNCSKDMVFDFEGSMVPGVAWFFKSFGALPQQYLAYSK